MYSLIARSGLLDAKDCASNAAPEPVSVSVMAFEGLPVQVTVYGTARRYSMPSIRVVSKLSPNGTVNVLPPLITQDGGATMVPRMVTLTSALTACPQVNNSALHINNAQADAALGIRGRLVIVEPEIGHSLEGAIGQGGGGSSGLYMPGHDIAAMGQEQRRAPSAQAHVAAAFIGQA